MHFRPCLAPRPTLFFVNDKAVSRNVHFGVHRNISTTIWWIAMKFCQGSHCPRRTDPTNFVHLVTVSRKLSDLPSSTPWCWKSCFKWNVSITKAMNFVKRIACTLSNANRHLHQTKIQLDHSWCVSYSILYIYIYKNKHTKKHFHSHCCTHKWKTRTFNMRVV